MLLFLRRTLAHDAALSRKSYSFAGADDIAIADEYPQWDVLPDVARSLLADGYPELARHLTLPSLD